LLWQQELYFISLREEMFAMKRLFQVIAQIAILPISIVSFDYIFTQFGKDTFNITNGLSVIAAAISALSFTAASVYSDGSRRRASFKLGGIRFFIASIAAAVGTVTKYAVDVAGPLAAGHLPKPISLPIAFVYGAIVAGFFYGGLLYCHLGLWTLCGELLEKEDA
jgi:hypothetical protein